MSIQHLLQGAYDLHVHGAPDPFSRRNNAFSLGRAAAEAGLAGMLLKEHTASTVGRCYVLNRFYDARPRFFGSLVLNPTVGGINPCAVEAALKAGVEVIYFPTYGSAHHFGRWGRPSTAYPLPGPDYPGLTALDEAGQIKADCLAVCDLIAAHDAVLATGHLSPRESLLLIAAAAERGVSRMAVTHASQSITAMSVDDQHPGGRPGSLDRTLLLRPDPRPARTRSPLRRCGTRSGRSEWAVACSAPISARTPMARRWTGLPTTWAG